MTHESPSRKLLQLSLQNISSGHKARGYAQTLLKINYKIQPKLELQDPAIFCIIKVLEGGKNQIKCHKIDSFLIHNSLFVLSKILGICVV